ncbi:MAG TPA: hypothetical protein VKA21_04215 [Candidatus Binatia bacterium]|nr:hypothetical protein [Candidatus Binatia bacterium]
MADETIRVGDRVVSLQVPGVCRVTARRGRLVEIDNDRGVHLTVDETSLRRVDGKPVEPKDT